MQYILNFNFHDYFYQYVLPTENERSYEINLSEFIGLQDVRITPEFFDKLWKIVSNDTVSVIENGKEVSAIHLTDNKLVFGKTSAGADFPVLMSPLSDEHL